MSRPPSSLKNAAGVPVFTVQGATAVMSSSCSRMQVVSWFDYDSREAERRRRDVVILERLQRPCRGLLFGHNRVRRRKYLVEVLRAHELLRHRDVRMVRLIQSKALRERLSEANVGGHRVLNHR